MRILVVEDEKRLAGTLADLLHRQGYTVDVSNDGVSGLDNALSGIYDLVVLDVMLPGMDGFELLRRLRGKDHPRPHAHGALGRCRPRAGARLRRGLLSHQAL